jgi:hypothetical protein
MTKRSILALAVLAAACGTSTGTGPSGGITTGGFGHTLSSTATASGSSSGVSQTGTVGCSTTSGANSSTTGVTSSTTGSATSGSGATTSTSGGCPAATTSIALVANLDARESSPSLPWDVEEAAETSNFMTSVTVYDSTGAAHDLSLCFRIDAAGSWEWHAVTDGGGLTGGTAGTPVEIANGTLSFAADGTLSDETQNCAFDPRSAVNPQPLTFNFGPPAGGVTDTAAPDSVSSVTQNGCP